jgi:hypothetical protein
MRCGEPGHRALVASVAPRGPGRWVVRRRPPGLRFLSALCVSVVIFTTEAQRTQRVLWVSCGGAQISFGVFRVVRGYIPSAVASPAVAANLEILAGDCLREDENHAVEPDRWSPLIRRRPCGVGFEDSGTSIRHERNA